MSRKSTRRHGSAEPPPLRVTLGTGQPKLRSMCAGRVPATCSSTSISTARPDGDRVDAVELDGEGVRLVGRGAHHLQRLRAALDQRPRGDHLADVEPGPELPAQRAERRVRDAGHRREHDGGVDRERAELQRRQRRHPLERAGHATQSRWRRRPLPPSVPDPHRNGRRRRTIRAGGPPPTGPPGGGAEVKRRVALSALVLVAASFAGLHRSQPRADGSPDRGAPQRDRRPSRRLGHGRRPRGARDRRRPHRRRGVLRHHRRRVPQRVLGDEERGVDADRHRGRRGPAAARRPAGASCSRPTPER